MYSVKVKNRGVSPPYRHVFESFSKQRTLENDASLLSSSASHSSSSIFGTLKHPKKVQKLGKENFCSYSDYNRPSFFLLFASELSLASWYRKQKAKQKF